MAKFTKRHLALFKKAFAYFQKELLLQDWDIEYDIVPWNGDTEADVTVLLYDEENERATIDILEEWCHCTRIPRKEIIWTAEHEAKHLAAMELTTMASNRFVQSQRALNTAEHTMIRRLQNYTERLRMKIKELGGKELWD